MKSEIAKKLERYVEVYTLRIGESLLWRPILEAREDRVISQSGKIMNVITRNGVAQNHKPSCTKVLNPGTKLNELNEQREAPVDVACIIKMTEPHRN